MTARPALSRRLGILFVVFSAVLAVAAILTAIGVYGPRPFVSVIEAVMETTIGALLYAAFAFFYLNSAVRLQRMGVPPKPAKQMKFRPTVKLG